jgi:hypothetical protein
MRTLYLAVALALTACATPYKPAGFAGGFTEQWRSKTVVIVDVKGNGFTDSRRVSEMALLRAAELAHEHDWPYFRIIGDANIGTTTYVPGSTTTYGQVQANGAFTAHTQDTGFTAIKPGSRIVVSMLPPEARDPSDPSIYEATAVIQRLGAKYHK